MQSSTRPKQPATAPRRRLPASPRRALLLGLCALAVGWGIAHWLNGRNDLMQRGVIAVSTATVAAPLDGRLIELIAAEHDTVHGGGSPALIEDSGLVSRIEIQTQRVAELQDELTAAEARADIDLAWRQNDLRSDIYSAQIQAADLLKQKLMHDVERLAWNDFQQGGDTAVQWTSIEEIVLTLQSPQFRSDEQQLRAALKEEAARNAAEVLDTQVELCDQRLTELRQLLAQMPDKVRLAAGLESAHNKLHTAERELGRLERQPPRVTLSAPDASLSFPHKPTSTSKRPTMP